MSTDLVPVDNMAALDQLDAPSREVAITGMLDQARTWLAHAVKSTAPAQDIAQFRAFIATAAETAKRLKVSKEIQTDAEVMVRRTERALGQAIRAGQERGEIGRQYASGGPKRDYIRGSQVVHVDRDEERTAISPREFIQPGGETVDIYALTDGVTDEQFDVAVEVAQEEGNVSRANVVRKVREVKEATSYSEQQEAKWARVAEMADRGYTSAQIARELGVGESRLRASAKERGVDIRADRVVGRARRLDTNRILRQTLIDLEGVIAGLDLINPADIDPEEAHAWVDSLTQSIKALAKARTTIKESIS